MAAKGQINPEELYTLESVIGKGSFGIVYKGITKKSGEAVAIKIIDLENAEDAIDDIHQEINILAQCDSPFITKYSGSYLKSANLWIIMEYMAGSAFDLMKPGPLEEQYAAVVIRELLKGLEYLHNLGIMHRDIKAANILISHEGNVKLADFGVAGQLTRDKKKRDTFVGTPYWMAPEVIQQNEYNAKADIWSTGITALELVNGEPPHAGLHPMRALFTIPKSEPPTLEGNFSKNFKEFISFCLNKDPEDRPTAAVLLRHKFFKNTRKNNCLIDLIDRYQKWRETNKEEEEEEEVGPIDDDREAPDFDFGGTVKSKNPTIKSQKEALVEAYSKAPSKPKSKFNVDTVQLKKSIPENEPKEDQAFVSPEAQEEERLEREKENAREKEREDRRREEREKKEKEKEKEKEREKPITDPFWVSVMKPAITKLKLELGPGANVLVSSLEDIARSDPKKLQFFVGDIIQGVSKAKDKETHALLPASARMMTTQNNLNEPGKASKTAGYLYQRWRERSQKDLYFLT